jgi:hypothetical protein
MTKILLVIFLMFAGCDVPHEYATTIQQNKFLNTIPICKKNCERKWEDAERWAALHLDMDITTVNKIRIQTANTTSRDFRLKVYEAITFYTGRFGAIILREPIGDDKYKIVIYVNSFPITVGVTYKKEADKAIEFNEFMNKEQE